MKFGKKEKVKKDRAWPMFLVAILVFVAVIGFILFKDHNETIASEKTDTENIIKGKVKKILLSKNDGMGWQRSRVTVKGVAFREIDVISLSEYKEEDEIYFFVTGVLVEYSGSEASPGTYTSKVGLYISEKKAKEAIKSGRRKLANPD